MSYGVRVRAGGASGERAASGRENGDVRIRRVQPDDPAEAGELAHGDVRIRNAVVREDVRAPEPDDKRRDGAELHIRRGGEHHDDRGKRDRTGAVPVRRAKPAGP